TSDFSKSHWPTRDDAASPLSVVPCSDQLRSSSRSRLGRVSHRFQHSSITIQPQRPSDQSSITMRIAWCVPCAVLCYKPSPHFYPSLYLTATQQVVLYVHRHRHPPPPPSAQSGRRSSELHRPVRSKAVIYLSCPISSIAMLKPAGSIGS